MSDPWSDLSRYGQRRMSRNTAVSVAIMNMINKEGVELMPKKIERIAALDSRLNDIAAACDLARQDDEPIQSVRLSCHEGPNMRFSGWCPYVWEGKPNREGRALRLSLYGVKGGQWVAAMSWCSSREGEIDITRARVVETVRDVMEAWDWSNSAKSAAKELRWDVNEYVGSAAP